MRPILIYLLVLVFYQSSIGQETKFKSRTRIDLTEEYYVLKDNKKIKHGKYIKYKKYRCNNYMFEEGYYLNGKRHGKWIFYDTISFGFFLDNKEIDSPFNFIYPETNIIICEGNYANGKKNGLWQHFYTSKELNKAFMVPSDYNNTDSVIVIPSERQIILACQYHNGDKVGPWASFDKDGNVVQLYDFSKKRLIKDSDIKDSLSYNSTRSPRYIGGYIFLIDFITRNFNKFYIFYEMPVTVYRDLNAFKNRSDSLIIKEERFHIDIKIKLDSTSSILDIELKPSIRNKALINELERILKLTQDNWIPALENGQEVAGSFNFKMQIEIANNMSFFGFEFSE